MLPLVATSQIKPDGSSFLFYFSTHFDHIFFVGVFLLFSRDHLPKRKQQKKTLLNMVVAVRVIRIKGDLRVPVIVHFSKIKYISSIK